MIPSSLSPRRARFLFGLLALAAAPAALHAQGAVPKNSEKEYTLTHPSSFNAPPANTRNPFWPIGWVPTAGAPVQMAVAAPTVRAEDFVVTTISMDAPALAVINGKTRGVGDQIPVSADGRDFVSVKQILDGAVVLDYRGREMRVSSGAAARKPAGK